MEQHVQYLMWLKSKQIFKSHFQPSINSFTNNSWEELAFAKDAAGPLGGFIWPPRSYSCAFCRREFRSAQALGGHMNVHRRDRARLKQSSLSPQPQLHIETPPPKSPLAGDSSSPYSSLSSASVAILPPQNSTTLRSRNLSSPQGSDTSNSGKFLSLSNQKFPRRMYSNKDVILDNEDTVDTNLSVGLSLRYGSYDKEESHNISSKRQRLMSNDITSLSFASKGYVIQTEAVRRKAASSIDDNIDLELRLG